MKIEVERDDLQKILALVEDCLHTSASNSGLKQRAENYEEMEKELLFMLNITDEEAEELYWKWKK